jgi:hypothetical protein
VNSELVYESNHPYSISLCLKLWRLADLYLSRNQDPVYGGKTDQGTRLIFALLGIPTWLLLMLSLPLLFFLLFLRPLNIRHPLLRIRDPIFSCLQNLPPSLQIDIGPPQIKILLSIDSISKAN